MEPLADPRRVEDETLRIPAHMGVIMDGNGRWAHARGLPRTEGHRAGVRALRRLVELCGRYGVQHLTVYSFSSENWNRPRDEISFIFGLLRRYVSSDLARLVRNNVRVRVIGVRERLDQSLCALIDQVEKETAKNTGLNLMIAFNYGGKAEIARAVRQLASDARAGRIDPEAIDEDTISQALPTFGIPDPDLILRTSGEQRLSNFLLWQSAYSELVFTETYWPDFDEDDFLYALREFALRERRFGGLGGAES